MRERARPTWGMILDIFLKIDFHRQRPSFEDSFVIFNGYSFPSGRTREATLLYGMLAAFAVIALEAWRWRVGAVLGAFVLVLLVGFNCVYLEAQYLSDVLGAAAAGPAWLVLIRATGRLRKWFPRTAAGPRSASFAPTKNG